MENYKEQLAHIQEMRSIMERSSRFFSLSGISGILVGIYALVAAALAWYLLYFGVNNTSGLSQNIFNELYFYESININDLDLLLTVIGLGTLGLSLLTVVLLSRRKAEKSNESIWNPSSRLFLWNLFLPLCVGGIFGLICLYKGWFGLIGPITLIFYGLALVNASKFTFGDIQVLGIMECLLGLASLFNIGYGLLFWAIGFGVLHIVYGIIIHYKYERQK